MGTDEPGAGAGEEEALELVRSEAGGDGAAAAGEPGLRLWAAAGGLLPHTARRRLLQPQHGGLPRQLRHEPALPGLREEPLELQLRADGHCHDHRPKCATLPHPPVARAAAGTAPRRLPPRHDLLLPC